MYICTIFCYGKMSLIYRCSHSKEFDLMQIILTILKLIRSRFIVWSSLFRSSQFLIPFRSNVKFVPRLAMFEQITPRWIFRIAIRNWALIREVSGVKSNMNLLIRNKLIIKLELTRCEINYNVLVTHRQVIFFKKTFFTERASKRSFIFMNSL